MIYITGDTHALIDYDKIPAFLAWNPELTKRDYVIVAGDFAGVTREEELSRIVSLYDALPITVLFVDGNHENFDLLDKVPTTRMFGGEVGRLSDSVYHLKRGELYEIEGKRIFTFGGGTSIDKAYRREGFSWWAREIPNDGEVERARQILTDNRGRIDCVVTHSCPTSVLTALAGVCYSVKLQKFRDNEMLEELMHLADFDKWYFGHYHVDLKLDERFTAVYRDFHRL